MSRANGHRADALREEIRHTRAELGETVQALAARADVPARMRASATHAAARFRVSATNAGAQVRRVGLYTPAPWVLLAGGATAALLVMVLWGRRR